MERAAWDIDGSEAFTAGSGLYETNTRSPWLVIGWLMVILGKVSKDKVCPPEAKGFQISPGECRDQSPIPPGLVGDREGSRVRIDRGV